MSIFQIKRVFFVIFILSLVLVFCCALAPAATKHGAKAQAKKQLIEKLSREERTLHKDLAKSQDSIKDLANEMGEAERVLSSYDAQERKVQAGLKKLSVKQKKTAIELERIFASLWPVSVRKTVRQGREISTWDQADREFVWLSHVYEKLQNTLVVASEQEKEMQEGLSRQQEIAQKARTQLGRVNKTKDKLLADSLRYRRKLAKVRKKKISAEAELKQILTMVDNLKFKLLEDKKKSAVQKSKPASKPTPKSTSTHKAKPKTKPSSKRIAKLKGKLPWPALGKIIKKYRPRASPPQRGVGLSLAEGTQVRAVAKGKVVHDDVLRGFGRVIIVFHTGDYYSLYAFLSQSNVRAGQEVVQGEVLGEAGYYPVAQGPGLYFELRFHQKAINPGKWLVANK